VPAPHLRGSRIFGQAHSSEGPASRRWKEVPVRGPCVARWSDARAAPQHVLADHELAVVLVYHTIERLEA
jgi:hypothetical protein